MGLKIPWGRNLREWGAARSDSEPLPMAAAVNYIYFVH